MCRGPTRGTWPGLLPHGIGPGATVSSSASLQPQKEAGRTWTGAWLLHYDVAAWSAGECDPAVGPALVDAYIIIYTHEVCVHACIIYVGMYVCM